MKVKELIEVLKMCDPELPVATHANNHTYMSDNNRRTHGPLQIGLLKTYGGDHVVIGNIIRRNINGPNWRVSEMIHGEAPEEC